MKRQKVCTQMYVCTKNQYKIIILPYNCKKCAGIILWDRVVELFMILCLYMIGKIKFWECQRINYFKFNIIFIVIVS